MKTRIVPVISHVLRPFHFTNVLRRASRDVQSTHNDKDPSILKPLAMFHVF